MELAVVLAGVLMLVSLGTFLIVFASRIGKFVFNTRAEIRKSLAKSPDNKSWNFVTSSLGLSGGSSSFVWGFRIIGLGFVAGAIFLLVGVLFSR